MNSSVVAIVAALVASYIAGSLWYVAFGKPWRAALGWSESASPPYRPTPVELGVAFAGQAAMAVGLAWLQRHLQITGVVRGIELGGIIWLGFILPSLTTNVVFQRRNLMLVAIDGLHWLLVLVVQGAIVGHFG